MNEHGKPLSATAGLHGSLPAEASRRHAAQARQSAAAKPVFGAMKIHQLVKKIILPTRSFAPPAFRPVRLANRIAAKMSELGDVAVSAPVFFRRGSRDLAALRGVSFAAAAGKRAVVLRPAFAAPGGNVITGWRGEVAAMRAAAGGHGGAQASAWRAGATLPAASGSAAGRVNSGLWSGGGGVMRALRAAPGASSLPKRRGDTSGLAAVSFAPRGRVGGSRAAMGNRPGVAATGAPALPAIAALPHGAVHAPVKTRFAAGGSGAEIAARATTGRDAATANPLREAELAEALRAYFFRQSRMPPSSMTGFDPRVSPAWAGLQMPG